MAINRKKGFALLIAVIFVSVVLALGTALASLAYKQLILASGGARSQYAFYAADAALECALYDTQRNGSRDPYLYTNHNSTTYPGCGGLTYQGSGYFQEVCYNDASLCPSQRVVKQKFPIAFTNPNQKISGTENLCAEVTVYETNGKTAGTTYVFSQGYDVPCAQVGTTNRIVARGLYARF